MDNNSLVQEFIQEFGFAPSKSTKEFMDSYREYVQERREKKNKKQREYRDYKRESDPEYREKEKQRFQELYIRSKEKYTCECGVTLRRGSKKGHEQSLGHRAFLQKTNTHLTQDSGVSSGVDS